MKKAILAGLFIFSLALNVAVAATLSWHFWLRFKLYPIERPTELGFGPEDFSEIRKAEPPNWRSKMMALRAQIMDKRAEILDLIAKDPGNPDVADKALQELIGLRGEEERQAIERISRVMATMPEEKRQAFLEFLKRRPGMGPGMGPGPGMGLGHRRGHRPPGGRGPGPSWDHP